MNEKDMTQLKESISMPSEMADTLLQSCTNAHQKHNRYSRCSKFCAVFMSLLLIGAVGSTSLAAYNVYQEKQLAVFMDADLTQEKIAAIGTQLAQIPGISSYHYVSADEAWEQFRAQYLDGLADQFEENPLADSFNYEVSIRMGADNQAIRDQISQLDGVRLITTIREANELKESDN